MNSIAPQEVWRSEAFAEDLFDDRTHNGTHSGTHSGSRRGNSRRVQMLSSTLLCALPVVVALLGGVVAFFHTIG